MFKLSYFSFYLCLIVLQTSCYKNIYNPVNIINMNQGYLKKIMAEKFNLNRQDGVIIIPNSFDDNHEILEYLNSKNKKDSLSMYFIVASKKNINKNHDFDMSNSIVISTSLPVLETKQNKLYLTAKVSTYYANNWTGSL